jgi:hypothetical protein
MRLRPFQYKFQSLQLFLLIPPYHIDSNNKFLKFLQPEKEETHHREDGHFLPSRIPIVPIMNESFRALGMNSD